MDVVCLWGEGNSVRLIDWLLVQVVCCVCVSVRARKKKDITCSMDTSSQWFAEPWCWFNQLATTDKNAEP